MQNMERIMEEIPSLADITQITECDYSIASMKLNEHKHIK